MKLLNTQKLTLTLFVAAVLLAGCNSSDKKNEAPQFGSTSFITETDVAIMDRLVASDENGDMLQFSAVSQPANGSLSLQPDGSFTYTPAAEFTGSDSFNVSVSDGELSAMALVMIDVNVATVSFLSYSRNAFAQQASAMPLPVNGRQFTQDAVSTDDYADLIADQ